MSNCKGFIGLSFKLNPETKEKLDWICKDQDLGLSTMLRSIIDAHVRKYWRNIKNES